MSTFDLLPAIDLRGGRVVRLRAGDFARETAYADDPVTVAQGFVAAGSRWLHVVDLDGARAGEPRQAREIGRLLHAVRDRGARVEVAGGIRSLESARAYLAAGAARVVIGTTAVSAEAASTGGRASVAAFVERLGRARVVVAVDVRAGRALGDGWQEDGASAPIAVVLGRLAGAGVATVEVTAIDRDGSLGGPDLDLLESIVRDLAGAADVIASGGIRSIDDLVAVRDAGCAGAIVGRALLEGRIDLAEALGV